MKGERYFAEIHLSRADLVPINRENRGVTVCQTKLRDVIYVFIRNNVDNFRQRGSPFVTNC